MTFNTMSVLLYCNCYLMYLPSPTESKALMTEDLSFCVPKTAHGQPYSVSAEQGMDTGEGPMGNSCQLVTADLLMARLRNHKGENEEEKF